MKTKKPVGHPPIGDYEIAQKLYDKGFSDSDIASYLGVSRQAVSRALHEIRQIPRTKRAEVQKIEGATMAKRALSLHLKGIQIGIIEPTYCHECGKIYRIKEVNKSNPLEVTRQKCKCGNR